MRANYFRTHTTPVGDHQQVVAHNPLCGIRKTPQRIFTEAFRESRRREYAQSRNLREAHGRVCALRLTGNHCGYASERGCPDCWPPGCDHPRLWIKDGKPYVFTFEPYRLSLRDLRELVAYCDRLGLAAEISGQSWHNAGDTFLIELRRAVPIVQATAGRTP